MSVIDELKALLEAGRWQELATGAREYTKSNPDEAAGYLFLASALRSLGKIGDAIYSLDQGQKLSPRSDWAASLRFSIMMDEGRVDSAFQQYREYLIANPGDEIGMATYVLMAAEHGRFEDASDMNSRRSVIRPGPRPRYAVALQTFIKADTLQQVFDRLLALAESETMALVILCDGVEGSKKQQEYTALAAEVDRVIEANLTRLASRFHSVELLRNTRNLGTAPSCRRLLDHVAERFEGFLFIEDDCLLAPEALRWTRHCLDNVIDVERRWFATCESVLFDAQKTQVSDADVDKLRALATRFEGAYSLIDFVPSTCFMTLSPIWKRLANIRSFTRGPESLNRYVKSQGMRTLAPIVPYAADIGMEHPLGYSSQMLGAEHIKEWKSTYVMAEKPFDVTQFIEVPETAFERLYDLSVRFNRVALDSLAPD